MVGKLWYCSIHILFASFYNVYIVPGLLVQGNGRFCCWLIMLGVTALDRAEGGRHPRHRVPVVVEGSHSMSGSATALCRGVTDRMLLSTAIALAYEGYCFDYSDSHDRGRFPFSRKESLRQQWNQRLCVLSILLTKNPAMRLGLNPLLCTYIVKRRSHEPLFTTFANILPETALYESYYNLTAENRRSSLLLHSLK